MTDLATRLYFVTGILVFLCDFYREQAWVGWIATERNGIEQSEANVEGIKEKLRRIAGALAVKEAAQGKPAL